MPLRHPQYERPDVLLWQYAPALSWEDDDGLHGRYRDRQMSRVLRAADTRELPLVLVLIAAALAEGHWSPDAEGLSPLGVVAAVAIAVPLLWRHRAPKVVLALVVAGVFACMATLKPGWSVVAVSAVAIYSVALHGDRLRTLATAGCVLAVTVAVMTLFSDRGLLSYDALTRVGILLSTGATRFGAR